MSKFIYSLILTVLVANAIAQDSTIVLSKVIEVDGDKATLYDKARLWSFDAFKKVQGAMQANDREAGLLAFDVNLDVPYKRYRTVHKDTVIAGSVPVTVKLKIQTKDNKYRYEVTDIRWGVMKFLFISGDVPPFKIKNYTEKDITIWKERKETTIAYINLLMDNLHEYMSKKTEW